MEQKKHYKKRPKIEMTDEEIRRMAVSVAAVLKIRKIEREEMEYAERRIKEITF